MATYDLDGVRYLALVCHGSSCRKHDAEEVLATLKAELKDLGIRHDVHLARTRCLGRCDDGCNLLIVGPRPVWYGAVSPKAARRIAREHLAGGPPVDDLLAYEMADGTLRKVGRGKRGKPRK